MKPRRIGRWRWYLRWLAVTVRIREMSCNIVGRSEEGNVESELGEDVGWIEYSECEDVRVAGLRAGVWY